MIMKCFGSFCWFILIFWCDIFSFNCKFVNFISRYFFIVIIKDMCINEYDCFINIYWFMF